LDSKPESLYEWEWMRYDRENNQLILYLDLLS